MWIKLQEARYLELLKMMRFLSSVKGYKLGYDSQWDGMIEHWTLRHNGIFIGRISTNHTNFYLNEVENA